MNREDNHRQDTRLEESIGAIKRTLIPARPDNAALIRALRNAESAEHSGPFRLWQRIFVGSSQSGERSFLRGHRVFETLR